MPYYLWPVVVLGGLLLLFGLFAALARFRGGQYLRPIVVGLAKVPLFRRLMTKASAAALERQNPELASALKKLERFGSMRDPLQAQRAISRLTPAERSAYLEAVGEQGGVPSASNRAERRRIERMAPTPRKRAGGKKKR